MTERLMNSRRYLRRATRPDGCVRTSHIVAAGGWLLIAAAACSSKTNSSSTTGTTSGPPLGSSTEVTGSGPGGGSASVDSTGGAATSVGSGSDTPGPPQAATNSASATGSASQSVSPAVSHERGDAGAPVNSAAVDPSEAGVPEDAVPSEGCGAAAPANGRYSVPVEGTDREYILRLPEDYNPELPYRLILAWHGRMYSADWVANGDPPQTGPFFGIQEAAQGQVILVAPQALSSSWTNQDGRDLAFAEALVMQLESELCVDRNRVFSTGFSMGAIMTITIGCTRGDLFRAIAPMSGSSSNGCAESDRMVAYWASHGLQDTTIQPAQGEAARDLFLARNGCTETSMPSTPEGCVSYQGCAPGYPVSWCTFEGEHVPPPFAGTAIWSFFSQF
jgi:poly(3-hydroxybutyrate) depolymerase